MAVKGKAIVRAVVRLEDGTIYTRLLTLYPPREPS
jgi:hypothetical protein